MSLLTKTCVGSDLGSLWREIIRLHDSIKVSCLCFVICDIFDLAEWTLLSGVVCNQRRGQGCDCVCRGCLGGGRGGRCQIGRFYVCCLVSSNIQRLPVLHIYHLDTLCPETVQTKHYNVPLFEHMKVWNISQPNGFYVIRLVNKER